MRGDRRSPSLLLSQGTLCTRPDSCLQSPATTASAHVSVQLASQHILRYRGMKNRGARESRGGQAAEPHPSTWLLLLPFPKHGSWERREIRKEMDRLRREQEE